MTKKLTWHNFLGLVAIIALVGVIACLAGCSSDSSSDSDSSSSSDSSAASSSSDAESSSSSSSSATEAGDIDLTDWDAVEKAAEGTTVTFYGWGEDDTFNAFMQGTVADYMKDNYNIDFIWNPVSATSEAVSIVVNEKQAGLEEGEGTCDLVWIDSENFATLKDGNLLYGDIQSLVPNANELLDPDSPSLVADAGTPVEGLEIPWDPGIYVYIHDTATTSWYPTDKDEWLEWVKEYDGFITYPSADDTYGRRMIWQFIAEVMGPDWWETAGLTENSTQEEIQEAIEPALEFMRDMNPYLKDQGQTYPSSASEWKTQFANGEVGLCFDWTPYSVGADIKAGTLPDTCEAFVSKMGTPSNMGYVSIPYDAPNVAGALVTINSLLTPELQYGMMEEAGYAPAIDYNRLDEQGKELADSVDVGPGSLTIEEVADLNYYSDLPVWLIEPLNLIWWDQVAGKYND